MDQTIGFCTSADGTRIAYAVAGAGPPLVRTATWMTHVALDQDGAIWGHWWRELAKSRTFVRYDQRGCGMSDREAPSYSLDARVKDLEAVVDSLDLTTFDLLGYSYGAMTAIEYAARHPERVSRMIIYGGFARGRARSSGRSPAEAAAQGTLIRALWDRDDASYLASFAYGMIPDAQAGQLGEAVELLRASMSGESAMNLGPFPAESFDVFDRLPEIETPSVVFHSLGSPSVDLEEGRLIASNLPNARFIGIPSRNHLLMADEPGWETFVSELRAFLNDARLPPADRTASLERREGLSRRELEALLLICAGKTDRVIADELSISTRTVSNHVKHILEKTGSANRAQAAVWAAHRGLV